jgi:pimeloyl-ACP methyl ester carboxylesterase
VDLVIGRRGLLSAAAGVAVAGAAGGWAALHEDHGPPGRIPDVDPGARVGGTFRSARRGGRQTSWSLAYPPGGGGRLPLLVFLHGLHQDHRTAFGRRLGLDRFLAAEVARSGHRFAIASVDAGTSYYHPRPDGEDAGAMVLEELLPLLAGRGVRTHRIGLMGLSMGGYGALRLSGILGARRCAVVVAESPALWTPGTTPSSFGFRDAEEYARFTVFGHQRDLAGVPVRLDCGTDDPFQDATTAYAAGFPPSQHPVVGFQPGAHELGYWRRMAPAQLAFVGRHLGV